MKFAATQDSLTGGKEILNRRIFSKVHNKLIVCKLNDGKKQSAHRPLSATLWGISWADHFPLPLNSNGITAELADSAFLLKFLEQNLTRIYDKEYFRSPFLQKDDSPSRVRFYNHVADSFLFKDAGRPCGAFIGNPVDWSTYYIRFIGILPQYRGKKLFQIFLHRFLEILTRFPIDRVEIDSAPSNQIQLHLLNKFGFNVTGMTLSERWGGLTRLTKFLSPDHEKIFVEQLCLGNNVQLGNSKLIRRGNGNPQ